MSSIVLDGKKIAAELRNKIKRRVQDHVTLTPGLAVIIVGEDSASHIYVTNKKKACLEVGITTEIHAFSERITEEFLLNLITKLNRQKKIHGILVQLPLPASINSKTIIESIAPHKDVDGFHPYNFGRLAQGNPLLRPCTPYGIILLLQAYNIDLPGKNVVIIGTSNIVGKPLGLEFLLAKATVTLCHSRTKNIDTHIRNADIIVSAAGVVDIINSKWLNKKQVLIDVGIHRLPDGTIRGDINFNEVKDLVAAITPVPGGVGPMTIAALIQNTLDAAEHNY